MASLPNYRKTFRLWWQKPLPTEQMHDEREVTFLELFYDLVYVVILAEIAHYLGHHLSWAGLGEFLFMGVFVMWAWMNGMFYHSLHGTNDISMRVFTFTQMLLMGAMTVFITDMFSGGADGFAITFGLFQLFFAALWFRTGYHDPAHRAASTPFSVVYVLSAVAMFATVGMDAPTNQYIWAVVVFGSMLMPLITYLSGRAREQAIEASRLSLDSIERFGLITIVALGEVIVSAINGVNYLDEFNLRNGLIGGLGILIAVGIWWLYFDFLSRRTTKEGFWNNQMFSYLHIPLVLGIAASGAILREMVVHNDVALDSVTRWLFVGSVAASVSIVAVLLQVVQQTDRSIEDLTHMASKVTLLCAAAILGVGLLSTGYIATLSLVLALLLLPVLYAVSTWIRRQSRTSRQ
ncbi:MAG: low temperature requirement protein A [Patescibacteria group bacterium]